MNTIGGKGNNNVEHFRDIHLSHFHKHLKFTIVGIPVFIVNAVRRAIIADVPTVAMHYVPEHDKNVGPGSMQVLKNTSPIYNEMLCKRLALVPVCVNEGQLADTMEDPSKYKFRLKKKNTDTHNVVVTSKDIEVLDREDKSIAQDERDALFPACPETGDHIILTKLKSRPNRDGGEIHVEAGCSVMSGRTHAMFCPTSACYFTNVVDDRAADEAYRSLVKDKHGDVSRERFDSLERFRYFKKNEKGEPREFEFFVECECGLDARFVVYMGFRSLYTMVMEKKKALQNRDIDKIKAVNTGRRRFMEKLEDDKEAVGKGAIYDFFLFDEDHTFGNLVQSLIFEANYVPTTWNREAPFGEISYVGYHQPHPLENYIIIRIRFKDEKVDPYAFFVKNLEYAGTVVKHYMDRWYERASLATIAGVERFFI
jgi:DNA-directed RNA polymerase subunit L